MNCAIAPNDNLQVAFRMITCGGTRIRFQTFTVQRLSLRHSVRAILARWLSLNSGWRSFADCLPPNTRPTGQCLKQGPGRRIPRTYGVLKHRLCALRARLYCKQDRGGLVRWIVTSNGRHCSAGGISKMSLSSFAFAGICARSSSPGVGTEMVQCLVTEPFAGSYEHPEHLSSYPNRLHRLGTPV